MRKGETWLLTDLASRHGTSINDRRIEPQSATPIEEGDVIAFGHWRCRCSSGIPRPGVTTPFAPAVEAAASVSAIPAQQLGGVAQRGLDVLMELTAKLDTVETREAVAQAAVDAVREATGCRRVVVVEPETDAELAVLASTSEQTPQVSRSLIVKAAREGLVQLMVNSEQSNQAQSIMDLGIRSAICAPITVDSSPSAFMTIDTRDAEGVVPSDAASFCQSVARVVGLAFQRISATSMAERHRQLQADLDAARRAQELLSPPKQGRHAAVSYRFESIPGRVVAGDLFDVFPLDESRTAFFLGDVSGKGVGAAMLMAACQSQLRSRLLSGMDLADAMAEANADLFARTEASKFITLVAGVFDSAQHTVAIVDAGHGLVLSVGSDGVTRLRPDPGFPLAVVDGADYTSLELSLKDHKGLVVFSDGAVEQPDADDRQFGLEGVIRSLSDIDTPDQAVTCVINAVENHAPGSYADDLTVASVWID